MTGLLPFPRITREDIETALTREGLRTLAAAGDLHAALTHAMTWPQDPPRPEGHPR